MNLRAEVFSELFMDENLLMEKKRNPVNKIRAGIQIQSAAFTAPSALPTEASKVPISTSPPSIAVIPKSTKPPSRKPTIRGSSIPSRSPSKKPSNSPTALPTTIPSSSIPSKEPSPSPSVSPSQSPSSSQPSSPKVCLHAACSILLNNCVPGAICSSAGLCEEDMSLLVDHQDEDQEKGNQGEGSESCTATGKPCGGNKPCCNPFAFCAQGVFGSAGMCSLDFEGCLLTSHIPTNTPSQLPSIPPSSSPSKTPSETPSKAPLKTTPSRSPTFSGPPSPTNKEDKKPNNGRGNNSQ